eukprot:COSAG02_NODE_4601_length_5177_cov_7.402718_3_plen_148_part_00
MSVLSLLVEEVVDEGSQGDKQWGDLCCASTATPLYFCLDVRLDVVPFCSAVTRSLGNWYQYKGSTRSGFSSRFLSHAIIERKQLDIGFKAVTFGTYGAFGKATHGLIKAATANTPRPEFSPWVRPSPKQHAYPLFGFTLSHEQALAC